MSTDLDKIMHTEPGSLEDTLREIIDGGYTLLFPPFEQEPGKPAIVGVVNIMIARVTPDKGHTIRLNNCYSRELIADNLGLWVALRSSLAGFKEYERQALRALEEQAQTAKLATGNGHKIIIPGEG